MVQSVIRILRRENGDFLSPKAQLAVPRSLDTPDRCSLNQHTDQDYARGQRKNSDLKKYYTFFRSYRPTSITGNLKPLATSSCRMEQT